MQPIILVAIAAAAIALSIGYMSNDIDTSMTQKIGVGESDFQSPVNSVDITLRIDRTYGIISADFKDFIVDCVFKSDTQVEIDSKIICKLVDQGDHVIAEGIKQLQTSLPQNTPTRIQIDQLSIANANQLQNIADIILIVQGPPQQGM